jgi:hypothetical protein
LGSQLCKETAGIGQQSTRKNLQDKLTASAWIGSAIEARLKLIGNIKMEKIQIRYIFNCQKLLSFRARQSDVAALAAMKAENMPQVAMRLKVEPAVAIELMYLPSVALHKNKNSMNFWQQRSAPHLEFQREYWMTTELHVQRLRQEAV